QGSFMPTSEGNYQFTYRVELKNDNNQWHWAGQYQENGYLKVEPASPAMLWTQGPSYVEVYSSRLCWKLYRRLSSRRTGTRCGS
ncbi:MAG: hypothetical protein LDL41_13170, partial [Coleofasciculus sp. S288]|nr:hypothetical protein [Coleofasciculus sp. S288]